MATLQQIYSWFETGDIPTQEEFQQTFSSFIHKEESISINKITGLESTLNNKLDSTHVADTNAHHALLARLDASNLNYENSEAWKLALGVGNIPDNVALVDKGEVQEVYNKAQILAMTMLVDDFVAYGKIRADKIEALGLTDLVEVSENSLASFVVNSAKYEFQQNDFIAIPVNGNYSLFIFKGGDKKVSGNYLPTGLTNITITMVEGLQTVLNLKLDKPTTDGNYFASSSNGVVNWSAIKPTSNYLLYWNESGFSPSSMFRASTGKLGIGTTAPTEQLQLSERLRTKAVVLDENSETLPQQVTYNSRKFYGTDSTGLKRPFQYADYDGFKALSLTFDDAQKTEWKTIMNGGFTTNTMSVGLISPPIFKLENHPQWITLLGANLNLNPTSFTIEIMNEAGNTSLATIPNSQVQLLNGINLTFWFNFYSLGADKFKLRLWNGVAFYVTPMILEQAKSLTPIVFNSNLYLYGGATSSPNSSKNSDTDANLGAESKLVPFGNNSIPVAGLFTDDVLLGSDDWTVTLTIREIDYYTGGSVGSNISNVFGLISGQNTTLNENFIKVNTSGSVAYLGNYYLDGAFAGQGVFYLQANGILANTYFVTYIKRGSQLTKIKRYTKNSSEVYITTETIDTNTNYSIGCVKRNPVIGMPSSIVKFQITEAYKLN